MGGLGPSRTIGIFLLGLGPYGMDVVDPGYLGALLTSQQFSEGDLKARPINPQVCVSACLHSVTRVAGHVCSHPCSVKNLSHKRGALMSGHLLASAVVFKRLYHHLLFSLFPSGTSLV